MSDSAIILRLSPLQLEQLHAILRLAEHYAASGKGCAFVAKTGTADRVAWIDLQIEVESAYAKLILKRDA